MHLKLFCLAKILKIIIVKLNNTQCYSYHPTLWANMRATMPAISTSTTTVTNFMNIVKMESDAKSSSSQAIIRNT